MAYFHTLYQWKKENGSILILFDSHAAFLYIQLFGQSEQRQIVVEF